MWWWPAKPQSVFVGFIFSVAWLTGAIFLAPHFYDALSKNQTLRLIMIVIPLALAVYWTVVGIQWCIDDWLGRKKVGVSVLNPEL
jgi:hypothetical protein